MKKFFRLSFILSLGLSATSAFAQPVEKMVLINTIRHLLDSVSKGASNIIMVGVGEEVQLTAQSSGAFMYIETKINHDTTEIVKEYVYCDEMYYCESEKIKIDVGREERRVTTLDPIPILEKAILLLRRGRVLE